MQIIAMHFVFLPPGFHCENRISCQPERVQALYTVHPDFFKAPFNSAIRD